ncbi:unnamed protein product [Tilletia controversa]|uniref:Rab-GAP TBC domain-containing protein n=2 Tax=Tilletia TaxID=13289 RepID=A0A177V9D8_9BASI|nr:hypothetical protein CF335_g5736 [Tilletia laevis]KAE8252351.1 hypothetical protein A4X03_0g6188 [Tilletia caries]CAD6935822.1 unnamed protein product [Tilletia controversa]KAE8200278.1 hypothetical protein CF336_g770 [Tilletia laevis]CAD6890879.1 unnamed protein product [Tilletia caries]
MQDLDIQKLRAAVLEPQGLGSPEERRAIWYALLGVQAPAYNAYKRAGSNPSAGTLDQGATPDSPVAASENGALPDEGVRSGLPTIQFGTLAASDSSSYDSDCSGGPDSDLGSGSVTTESQHAAPTASNQLKPPTAMAPSADEWQTVSKRKRAGSRAQSQQEDHDGQSVPPTSQQSTPVERDDVLSKTAASQDVSRAGASSPAPKSTVGPTRSVNRFDALSDPASKKPTAPNLPPARKQHQSPSRNTAGSPGQSPVASTSTLKQPEDQTRGAEAHVSGNEGQAEPRSKEEPVAESKSSVDRIAEMLREADGLSPRDAHQVDLDVNRSFLNFRKGSLKDPSILAARRRQLSSLCMGVLQRRKALSYYQGYHDVLTVLLLTLLPDTNEPDSVAAIPSIPPELHLAAERLSLHWLRDAMTRNLDAVMGHLRLLSVLLQKIDPELAAIVQRAFPLPYFALPWLITLLTHSLPDLALAQRVLDFVLVYGPVSTLYLCIAIMQLNKDTAQAAGSARNDEDEFEAEMRLHQALAALPSFKLDEEAAAVVEEEEEYEDRRGDDQFADAVGDDSLYDDPDVFGPADASATALSNSISSGGGDADGKGRKTRQSQSSKGSYDAIPISRLLRQAADLMERHGLGLAAGDTRDEAFDGIMGPGSVLQTWLATVAQQRLGNPENGTLTSDQESSTRQQRDRKWDQADERAEYIMRVDCNEVQPDGPEPADSLLIVRPELPAATKPLGAADEKTLNEEDYGEKPRRPRMRTRTSVRASHKGEQPSLAAQTTTVTIAALGVAGVVLGMYAASNSGSTVGGLVAAGAGDRAEQARNALALLSRWLSLMH